MSKRRLSWRRDMIRFIMQIASLRLAEPLTARSDGLVCYRGNYKIATSLISPNLTISDVSLGTFKCHSQGRLRPSNLTKANGREKEIPTFGIIIISHKSHPF